MIISNQFPSPSPIFSTRRSNSAQSEQGTVFSLTQAAPVQTSKSNHIVYMKDSDTLYSGGNGTGLSFHLKYADNSTEESPVILAKGVDENGNPFEQIIHVNDINPHNASLVEMRALEAHLGVDKQDGLSSLPYDTGTMGLNDRTDFLSMFKTQIHDMNVLKQYDSVAFFFNSMNVYDRFFEEKSR